MPRTQEQIEKPWLREKKVRHARFRVLCNLLYNRELERPAPNRIITAPTQLSRLAAAKAFIIKDCLEWLDEMQYINILEWKRGYVELTVNADLLMVAPSAPQAEAVSPSDCAVGGGTENIIASPSLDTLMLSVSEDRDTWAEIIPSNITEGPTTEKDLEKESSECQITEMDVKSQEQEQGMLDRPSEESSTPSTSLAPKISKRRLRFTTE